MNDSANHPDGLDPLDLAAAILAELGNPTDEQIAAWNRDAEAAQAAIPAELIRMLDSLVASDSTSELLDLLESSPQLDELDDGEDLAALLDLLESSPQLDELDDGEDLAALLDLLESSPQLDELDDGEDLAALLDLLESPDQCEAELREINKQRERIIRKLYGRGR
ncbi:hypothetical protein E3T35_03710 [Cryobacterium sp. TMT1-2-2]|uniref:hypothetical protein n=1 Tax=Cryobacterium sp. TMT1-2-2 TaxID=1259233 RepID=UPI00106A5559|nr:hypothetical protein [Cryobacterium sp. TMT1-2-2]TFD13851.1 hypothetical protein E3T35_03710 [Cryobacterium sp. TMT1-2-2]